MLGAVFRKLFSRATHRGTDFATAYRLYERGDLDEADRACRELGNVPGADARFLAGLIAQKRGDLRAAARAMSEAVDARGDEPGFRFALAEVLAKLDRHDEAIAQMETLLAAALSDTHRAAANVMIAQSLMALDEHARAEPVLRAALAIEPGHPVAAPLLALALHEASETEAARALLPSAPPARYATRLQRALLLPFVYDSREHIAETRERLTAELDLLLAGPAETVTDPVREVGVTSYMVAYHNANNAPLLRSVGRALRRVYDPPPAPHVGRRRRGGPIRVGFVSTYFHMHSVGRDTIGYIRDLPRDRFSVEVFAVTPREDALRADIERAADRYHRLPADLERVRSVIEAAGLDVLVYGDIGMHPLTTFLAMARLAPLQIATWGHSETSGLDTVDCYLSADAVEIPGAQAHYTETLLRPDTFFLAGYARPQLARAWSRDELGLPPDRHVYACPQSLFKLHPDVDAVFDAILERDPLGEIVLLGSPKALLQKAEARFDRTIPRHRARVRFLPRIDHQSFLATLAASDVVLDPLYFGGCNSSAETLAFGVPIVTLPGTHLYGRFTLGLYKEIELADCVAESVEDFVGRAVRLATEPDHRREVSARIDDRVDAIFDRPDATLALGEWIAGRVEAAG